MATQRTNLPLSYDLETLFDDTESSDETSADMIFSTDAVADHNSRTARPVPRLANLDCCRSVSSTISVHNAQCRRSVSSTIPVPDQQVSDAVVPCIEGSIQSIQSSRYSATSTASSRLSVRPIGNVLMTPGHNMFTGTDIQPRRTYVTTRRSSESSVERDAKRKKNLSPEEINELATQYCCPNRCLTQISFQQVSDMRMRHIPQSSDHINEMLMDIIQRAHNSNSKSGKKYMYSLETGHLVCAEACARVFGRSLKHFRRLKTMVYDGQVSTFRHPRSHRRCTWKDVFIPWLEDYAQRYGQQMPNSHKIELCVGSKMQIAKKFQVHAEGMCDLRSPPVESTMYALWKTHAPHIICPKRNSFSKCTACCTFKNSLQKAQSYKNRVIIVQEFDKHLDAQMRERMQYYRNRAHARSHPEEAMSVILDGMTQKTTEIPYFPCGAPKSIPTLRYGLHVFGALVHGHTPRVFLHDAGIPTGPNLSIETLWRVLHLYEKDCLPPLLYLQLDNTSSDNKNHHVLEFCAWLVEEGYFKDVKIGFMMVGHTHDDIDQMFSRFSIGIRQANGVVYSVPQLGKILVQSFKPTPDVVFLYEVHDWKSCLDTFSTSQLENTPLHGHLRPLQYHLFLNDEGRSVLKWKRFSVQEEWFPILETTPTVHLLSCRGSFEGLVVVPHQPLCSKDKVDLAKVFAVSSTFTSSAHIVAEQKVYLTSLFTGDRSTFGPIGTGFKDLPDLKKWKNASIAEAVTTAVSTVVYEDEVHSEDEEMVYQGRLHSLDKTRVKHKSNFMDPTLIEVGNLALLRMNDDEIAVAKIMSIDLDERVIHIHWYGSLPLPNDLRKAQGPLNKLPPAGLSANARSKWKREKYTQTVSIDTVLVEAVTLNKNTKYVPQNKIKLATRRLAAAKSYEETAED